MYEPGLDRHAWESEMETLVEELEIGLDGTLPDLDSLVARVLNASGYALDDPVARSGDEREVVSEFLAAREITRAVESGSDELSPGDVAAAINGYRAVFDSIIAELPTGEIEPGELEDLD